MEEVEEMHREARQRRDAQNESLRWESTTADGLLEEQRKKDRQRINRFSAIHAPLDQPTVIPETMEDSAEDEEIENPEDDLETRMKRIQEKAKAMAAEINENLERQKENWRREGIKLKETVNSELQKEIEEKTANTRRQMENIRKQMMEDLQMHESCMEKKVAEQACTIAEVSNNVQVMYRLTKEVSEKINNQDMRMQKYEERLKNQREAQNISLWGGMNLSRVYAANQKPPCFGAEARERPIRYLRELTEYCRVMEIEDLHYTIGQSLKGTAKDWWRIIEDKVENLEQFAARFQSRYWNRDIQDRIRAQLEFGAYEWDGRGMTKAEYAAKVIGNAKDLTQAPTEEEAVLKLSKHFDEQIRSTIMVNNIKTIDQLLEVLERTDAAGPLNIHRRGQRQTNDRNPNSNGNFEYRGSPHQNGSRPIMNTWGTQPRAWANQSRPAYDQRPRQEERRPNETTRNITNNMIARTNENRALTRPTPEIINERANTSNQGNA